jgi:hypothetical protein
VHFITISGAGQTDAPQRGPRSYTTTRGRRGVGYQGRSGEAASQPLGEDHGVGGCHAGRGAESATRAATLSSGLPSSTPNSVALLQTCARVVNPLPSAAKSLTASSMTPPKTVAYRSRGSLADPSGASVAAPVRAVPFAIRDPFSRRSSGPARARAAAGAAARHRAGWRSTRR